MPVFGRDVRTVKTSALPSRRIRPLPALSSGVDRDRRRSSARELVPGLAEPGTPPLGVYGVARAAVRGEHTIAM